MRCASYRSAHARSPAFPAKKKKPCRAERRPRCRRVGRRQRSCRQPMDCSPTEESARLNRSVRGTAVMVTTRSTLILNPEDDGATESPAFGPWPQIGDRAGQDGNPHVAGAVSIDRRARALLPTVMAPSIANDFRHQSEEVPMCERARVSHNRRVPRKAQIAALLPALFLENYIINIAV